MWVLVIAFYLNSAQSGIDTEIFTTKEDCMRAQVREVSWYRSTIPAINGQPPAWGACLEKTPAHALQDMREKCQRTGGVYVDGQLYECNF